MSLTPKELFEAGQLAEAIAAVTAQVKSKPTDTDSRWLLAELLCHDGLIDRADKLLDAVGVQDTQAAIGVALFRQILRGAMTRQEVFDQGRAPELLVDPTDAVAEALKALAAIRAGDTAAAKAAVDAAEDKRPRVSGKHGDVAFDDLRDADDVTAPVWEVITSTGKYFWVPCDRVEILTFYPPERPRDLIWRRARMIVDGGPDGEVFIPALYMPPAGATLDDQLKLGRATDWMGEEGEPVRGLGQRMFLMGDEPVPITELRELEFSVG